MPSENTTLLAMCAELGFHIADDPDDPGVSVDNPPTGVVIPRGSTSMRNPRGGRLLIIEKMIPHARSAATTV